MVEKFLSLFGNGISSCNIHMQVDPIKNCFIIVVAVRGILYRESNINYQVSIASSFFLFLYLFFLLSFSFYQIKNDTTTRQQRQQDRIFPSLLTLLLALFIQKKFMQLAQLSSQLSLNV